MRQKRKAGTGLSAHSLGFIFLVAPVFLTILLCLWVNKIFRQTFCSIEDSLFRAQKDYEKLLEENKQLQELRASLDADLQNIIALYDTTKQICKTLDEVTVFNGFYSQLQKYLHFKECKFIKDKTPPKIEKDDFALPLKISRRTVGFLHCSGVAESGKVRFNILAQQFFLGMKRAILYQEIQELAISDSLTGVSSRRHCLDRLSQELERSKKFNYPFSVLMVDIDYFKTYNDRYGHLVGDAILKEVCVSIKENVRQIDIVGRYGGEEFCIILAETDKEQALQAAQRIRQAIEAKLIRVYDEYVKVTVSLGLAMFPKHAKDIEKLIDCADQALYQAKQEGRNRVSVYGNNS
jgi:diguanylate cyclase (GGDEF)-like protein